LGSRRCAQRAQSWMCVGCRCKTRSGEKREVGQASPLSSGARSRLVGFACSGSNRLCRAARGLVAGGTAGRHSTMLDEAMGAESSAFLLDRYAPALLRRFQACRTILQPCMLHLCWRPTPSHTCIATMRYRNILNPAPYSTLHIYPGPSLPCQTVKRHEATAPQACARH
jgi:hypothetical protein